jgi:hypothetical protein
LEAQARSARRPASQNASRSSRSNRFPFRFDGCAMRIQSCSGRFPRCMLHSLHFAS